MAHGLSILLLCTLIVIALAGPNDYFTEQDGKQIEKLILSKQDSTTGSFNKNLKDTSFAVQALTSLGAAVPEKEKVCKYAKESLVADSIESIFYSVSTTEALGCGSVASEKIVNQITSSFDADTLTDKVYAVGAVAALSANKHITIDSKEMSHVVSSIKDLTDAEYGTWYNQENQEEGSPFLAGLALSALAHLEKGKKEAATELESVIAGISVLLQHGEEGDNSLTFRHTDSSVSSLKTTAFLIKGVADLAQVVKDKKVLAQDEQVAKIANFLISQKSVTSIEDAHALLVGLKALNSGAFKKPVVISLVKNQIYAAKEKESDIKVVVTDIWGKVTGKNRVYLIRAYKSGKDDVSLLSNQELPLVQGEQNKYSLDFLVARPDPGAYVLEFRVVPQESGFQTITSAPRRLQVVAHITLSDGTLAISDHTDKHMHNPVKSVPFSQDTKHKTPLQVGPSQHLFVNFKLKNSASGRSVTAHQTFVKLTSTSTKKSAYFVVPATSAAYEIRISAESVAKKFSYENGTYELEILIGDSYIDKSFRWVLASLVFDFGPKPAGQKEVPADPFLPRPEIKHIFRPDAQRAPAGTTSVFVVLVLVPIAIFLLGILRAGGNLSNYPGGLTSVYALLFLGGLGSLFGLIFLYWIKLKLFEVAVYIGVVAVPTIFFGNQVLRYYANQRSKQKRE